jgi:hypothetical protein
MITRSVNLFVSSEQELAAFVRELAELFTIEFDPIEGGDAYQFRNGAIALTVKPHSYPNLEAYRYHLLVTGDVYGTPHQRVKWIVDWAYDFYQALKATGRYRIRRAELPAQFDS